MALSNTISIIIAAKDEASKVLEATAGSVKETSSKLESFGATASAVGGNLSKFVTLPVVGIGLAAVKMAADFQSSMTRLVTSAGESKDNLAAVSAGVLQVSRDTGTSTDELAKALYTVESGGQHGADGLTVLKAAAQGAKTENSDLATVADAVTSVLVDYHLKAEDAALVTTKLVAATSAGKTTFEQLAAAMPAILPVASAAHVSLNDILGDLAAMTVHGMSAEQSAQNLADTIRHMQAPTAQQAKELALLGLTTTQLADDLKNKGLSGTLQEISTKIMNLMPPGSDKVILNLKTALTGLSQPVQDLGAHLFDGTMTMKDYTKAAQELDPISAKQALSFATLAGATHRIGDEQMTGADVLQNYGQALSKATGDATGLNVALMLSGENANVANSAIKTVSDATNEAGGNVKGWAEIQETFNFKLQQFEAVMHTSAITLGNDLLPPLTKLVEHVANAAKWFEQLTPAQQHFLEQAAGFAAIVGPAVLIVGKLATGLSSIIGLSTDAAKALGLIKTTGLVTEAVKATSALGKGVGLATAAEEATGAIAGGGGLLAALGPVGLVLGGAAVVAGGAYLAFKHLGESERDVTSATVGAFQPMSLLTLAQDAQKQATDRVTQATNANIQTQINHSQAIKDAQTATDNLHQAQDGVKQALDTFGANSPQYQQAVNNLSAAQNNYDDKLLTEWSLSVNLKGAEDDLKNKRGELYNATSALRDIQERLNEGLDSGNTIVARFGPNALAQVGSIDTLQVHIGMVVSAWNNANATLQSQMPELGLHLQGLASTINAVQGQGDNLVNTLQHASGLQVTTGSGLQGGSTKLQGHAMGTSYAPGGMTLVGERGPELINLPKGSKVYNDKDTSQMMQPASTTYNYLSGTFTFANKDAVDAFWQRLDKTQRLARSGMGATA